MDITWVTVLVFAGALGLVYGLGRILLWPARKLGKLLLNGILGGLVLFAINALGGLFGLKVGLNPLTALIAGTLGLPGVALVLILPVILSA